MSLVVEQFADAAALVQAALARVLACVDESVEARGRCTICLSGGSTPRALYQALARHPTLPWAQIFLFFGDERAVPPEHPDSNARMVREALTDRAFIPGTSVLRIPAELGAEEAARVYEATLHAHFPGETFPRFDLVLLGLGSDGHTASLFPHSPGLAEHTRWVCANSSPHGPRVTLTFPALNAARQALFLVSGADKRDALRRLLAGEGDVGETPARGIVGPRVRVLSAGVA